MTIMGKMNRLGNAPLAYPVNTDLFDGNNGASDTINLKKGIYYVRAQGAGGSGGNNIYAGNGGGGASGAGFEGFIRLKTNLKDILVVAGKAGTVASKAGDATSIGTAIILNGGGGGGTDNNVAGIGGVLTIDNNLIDIPQFIIKSNGENGNLITGSNGTHSGGNSVLTKSGGGIPGGNKTQRNASAPGAGGAGGKAWDSAGGLGMYGELLIRFVTSKL